MNIRNTILLICICCVASLQAMRLPASETLNYKVLYKWGLIHKQAGTARFVLKSTGNTSRATVYARSAKWADAFYPLRDTLSSVMNSSSFLPSRYERIAHEDGKYSHDLIQFSQNGNTIVGNCRRWRRAKGKSDISTASLTLTSPAPVVDLLSSFYYLRSLPYETMSAGDKRTLTIFSGKRKETLTITYQGVTKLKIDHIEHSTYKILFTFTSGGKKNTSDPIEAWVSTNSSHIPLKLVGKLKIGQVQCIYSPS